jgi:uncharacterized cupredoxin-like copper-binding protein
MKNIVVSVVLYTFFISLVFAGGDNDHHHGGHHKTKLDSDKMMKEDHGHGEGGHKGAVGKPATPEEATRTIPVVLNDQMKIIFKEPLTEIKSGSIIKFTVANEGDIRHEFSIGNQEEQKEHAEMMRKMPSMVHTDGNTIMVDSGKTKILTWHFEGEDTVVFSCNIPGHYEAGMFKNVVLKQE